MRHSKSVVWFILSASVAPAAQYTGSAACKTCHAQVYERWTKTRMANVVRDPKEHPDAILPDLSKPDPLVKFGKDDIASSMAADGNNAISKKSETTTLCCPPSGTSPIKSGAHFS
jgi:hypothetical protein